VARLQADEKKLWQGSFRGGMQTIESSVTGYMQGIRKCFEKRIGQSTGIRTNLSAYYPS
jgi:hypothetical protein